MHHRGRAPADLGQGGFQGGQLRRAPNEERLGMRHDVRLDGDGGARRAERVAQRLSSRPRHRIRVEELVHDGGERRRERHRRRRPTILLPREDVHRRANEREPAGERLEQHHADAVPIGRRRGPAPEQQLGRHVGEGADELALARRAGVRGDVLDQPEVDQHDAPAPVDQHVARLDVPVHLSGAVDRAQTLDELQGGGTQSGVVLDERRRRRGQPLAHETDEVRPLHQLHGEEALAVGHVEVVETGHVRVGDVSQDTELALEEIELLGLGTGVQALQRDLHEQLPVPRPLHPPHRARADVRAQLVAR